MITPWAPGHHALEWRHLTPLRIAGLELLFAILALAACLAAYFMNSHASEQLSHGQEVYVRRMGVIAAPDLAAAAACATAVAPAVEEAVALPHPDAFPVVSTVTVALRWGERALTWSVNANCRSDADRQAGRQANACTRSPGCGHSGCPGGRLRLERRVV